MILDKAIHEAIDKEIENIVKVKAHEAALQVERQVRAKTAEIAAMVCRHMTIEYPSPETMRITVDFRNTNA